MCFLTTAVTGGHSHGSCELGGSFFSSTTLTGLTGASGPNCCLSGSPASIGKGTPSVLLAGAATPSSLRNCGTVTGSLCCQQTLAGLSGPSAPPLPWLLLLRSARACICLRATTCTVACAIFISVVQVLGDGLHRAGCRASYGHPDALAWNCYWVAHPLSSWGGIPPQCRGTG